MERTKILVNGYIGNKEITSIVTPEQLITIDYIKDGISNPQKWKLSKVLNGWVITEEWNDRAKKWKDKTIIDFKNISFHINLVSKVLSYEKEGQEAASEAASRCRVKTARGSSQWHHVACTRRAT